MTENYEPGYLLGGRFLIIRSLGKGAVGTVWLAADIQLHDEPVACKILAGAFAEDRRAIADLKREVLLTRKLRHPNIVAIHTFWDSNGERFITMEYVGGKNFATLLAERVTPFTVEEVLPWIRQLCDALDHAHKQSILHRDIKPANILLGQDGEARLTDFGIARTAREASARQHGSVTSGTLLFMSPEQLMGEPLDHRSDLYSLAATIYEWIGGAPPFYKGSIAMQIQSKLPDPIPHCHEAVNRVLLKALSKKPEDRQDSCGAFAIELEDAASRTEGRPASPVPKANDYVRASLFDPNANTVALHTPRPADETKQLGELLVEAGVISKTQLDEALAEHVKTQEMLGMLLVRKGHATEKAIVEALERQLRIPSVRLGERDIDLDVARMLPRAIAAAHSCLLVRREGGRLLLATATPLDFAAINEAERALGQSVEPRIAAASEIANAMERVYSP